MLSLKEARDQGLEQFTLWMSPSDLIDSQWGLVRAGEWMRLEAERIGAARPCEIVREVGTVALFGEPLSRADLLKTVWEVKGHGSGVH